MSRRTRDIACATMGVAVIVCMSGATAVPDPDDCLFANTPGERIALMCDTEDPLAMARDSDVQRALAAIGLSTDRVALYGCPGADFFTRIATEDEPATYAITYPIDRMATREKLVAPLLHELAHVYQLSEGNRSVAELRDALGSSRIELGADFLAGWIAKRLDSSISLADFEHNLELVGEYFTKGADHNQPEERTFAFRYGYFHEDVSIRRTNAEFQRDLYAQVSVGRPPSIPPLPTSSAVPTLQLDKLTACGDLRAMAQDLRTSRRACRPPGTEFEQALVERLGEAFRLQACFVEPPPPLLDGYRCYVVDMPGARELTCVRPLATSSIAAYRSRFATDYKQAIAGYLVGATACRLGQGEATHTSSTQMPYSLQLVGKHELGFRVPIGDTGPRSGTAAVHAFASEDPSIEGEDRAFEYVSLWIKP
jgi:hypothetical protein